MQVSVSYDEAMGRKYPESVVIAIARDNQGKYNPITLGWFMPTSHTPPMVAISVAFVRHSYAAIRNAKEFVLSFPSHMMTQEALFFGTKSGRDTDKLAALQTPTLPATQIDGVLLKNAVANFECVLEGEMATGDHAIFAGRVLAAHVNVDRSLQRLFTLGTNYKMGPVVAAP